MAAGALGLAGVFSVRGGVDAGQERKRGLGNTGNESHLVGRTRAGSGDHPCNDSCHANPASFPRARAPHALAWLVREASSPDCLVWLFRW